ncbi:unnamed protein product [Malus baccata var. baccata]
MAHHESRDLSIMKGDNLLPEQRKKTGQRGHHRSASQTKGVRIHDRAHGKKCGWTTSASINKRTSFQEPRSVNLGGKTSYPRNWNCCRSGNHSCTQFCGVWICDLIVLPPCIAKLSCRKLIALNSVSVLDLQQSPPNLHL